MSQAKQQTDTFISTHARIILSDYRVLADLLIKHSQLIKKKLKPEQIDDSTPKLARIMSRREIEDAINGPMQAFFRQKMLAYMKISRIRMNLHMMEEDTLKNKRAELSNEDQVPETILQKTSLSDLLKIQQALNTLTTEHAQVWEASREQWIQELLERVQQENLILSEIEIKEFMDPEPISELLTRFVALNIALPKTKTPRSEMNFSTYLTLKTDIMAHSALSRQHMPHQQSDIQTVLNCLKSNFNAIAKQESKMISTQKTNNDNVVANIS